VPLSVTLVIMFVKSNVLLNIVHKKQFYNLISTIISFSD